MENMNKSVEFIKVMDEVMLTKRQMSELEKKYDKDSHMTGDLELCGKTETHIVEPDKKPENE